MHRPDTAVYNRPEIDVVDVWRCPIDPTSAQASLSARCLGFTRSFLCSASPFTDPPAADVAKTAGFVVPRVAGTWHVELGPGITIGSRRERVQHHSAGPDGATEFEPIVAVFDSKTMAHRTVAELAAAEFDDIWLGIVRGETHDGETTVAPENGNEVLLCRALAERGSSDAHAHRFDGILPPGTAVMSLRVRAKFDHALNIIELTGGHVEHF